MRLDLERLYICVYVHFMYANVFKAISYRIWSLEGKYMVRCDLGDILLVSLPPYKPLLTYLH